MIAALIAFAAPAMAVPDRSVSQDVEQEADSGDVDQSFEVSGTGDNSNQTVSIQGVANTGNAQNAIGVFDGDGFFDDGFLDESFFFCDEDDDDGDGRNECEDLIFFFPEDDFFFGDLDGDGFADGFEFEEVGASIDLNPEQVVNSDQEVNQAASASG